MLGDDALDVNGFALKACIVFSGSLGVAPLVPLVKDTSSLMTCGDGMIDCLICNCRTVELQKIDCVPALAELDWIETSLSPPSRVCSAQRFETVQLLGERLPSQAHKQTFHGFAERCEAGALSYFDNS